MKQVKLSEVKKGEYIRFKQNSPVWIKSNYDRTSKKYSVYKFDDINHESLKKGSTLVFVDFTF